MFLMTTKTNKNNIRIPPQSIPSEQAVLGSIMLRKDAIQEVEAIINQDSFYVEKHKLIFQAMLDLFLKNEPIDMLSLSTKLGEQKLLERVGGNQYLAEIVNVVPSSTNVKHYADIVQTKFLWNLHRLQIAFNGCSCHWINDLSKFFILSY